jgi:phage terminase small subunit
LTLKQERFVQQYLIEPNATKAAIRAGYSPKAARFVGCKNITKANIAAAIEKAQAKRAERCELTIFADESRDHHVVVPRVPGIGRELR